MKVRRNNEASITLQVECLERYDHAACKLSVEGRVDELQSIESALHEFIHTILEAAKKVNT